MFFPFSSHDRTNPLVYPSNIFIEHENHFIEFVPDTKILGVTLDNKLKFDKHISNVITKVNSKTFILSRNLKNVLFKLSHHIIQDFYNAKF